MELRNLSASSGGNAWVVDTRYPDRAALVPTESQQQPDGTYRVRFNAPGGGTGRYIVVPAGQEQTALSITRRSIKAPRFSGSYLATGPADFSTGVQPLLTRRA